MRCPSCSAELSTNGTCPSCPSRPYNTPHLYPTANISAEYVKLRKEIDVLEDINLSIKMLEATLNRLINIIETKLS